MPSRRSGQNLTLILLSLVVFVTSGLPVLADAPRTIPVVSRVVGFATVTMKSGASHELGSVEPLQSGATLTTAIDSIASVFLEQVGQVRLGPQTKASVSVVNGWLSFQMSSGSLCVISQSQDISVNTGNLLLAVSSPSTTYDVLQDGAATTIAVFSGGIVVGGPHTSTTTIYAGSAATQLGSGTLSDVPIGSVVGDFAKLKCPDADVISQVVPSPAPSPAASHGSHGATILYTLLGLGAIAAAAGHSGGGSGGAPTNAPPGALIPAPMSLSFGDVGSGNSKSFTVRESNYGGTFTIDGSACAGTASVSPLSGTPGQDFAVTPLAAGGPCNVKVTDDHAGSANVSVTVGPFGAVVPNPSSISLSVGGSASPISVSESGYTGVFSVAATGCSAIVTITPASGTSFSVSPHAVGNCRITFDDDHGQSAPSFAFVTTGTMSLSPQTLQLSGTGDTRSFTVSDTSSTTFTAISSDLTVATVTLVANTPNAATFNATGVLNGKATIMVTDTLGGAGNVSVGVGQPPLVARRHTGPMVQPHPRLPGASSPPVSQAPRARLVPTATTTPLRSPLITNTPRLFFARAGMMQVLTITEKGYAGVLSVTGTDANVASVGQAFGAGEVRSLVVTSRGAGHTQIRITDDHGGQLTIGVTVLLAPPGGAHARP